MLPLLTVVASLFMLLSVPAVASADIGNSLCGGSTLSLNNGDCASSGVTNGTSSLNTLITNIVNVFSVIVGVIAVIMIIVGGFQYVTSNGDSGKISSARNTIIYALVGLVLVAVAQFIVQFVLNRLANLG